MASVALSLATLPSDPLGSTRAVMLLAQARGLAALALNRALGPAAQLEGRLFATLVEAAAPGISARTRQQAQQTATGLAGLLRAATAVQTAGGGLQAALAGMLLGPEAPEVARALFSTTTTGTTQGSPLLDAGGGFAADVRHQAQRGINTFTLAVGTQRFELHVTLEPQETNRDVLAKIAGAINSTGAALKATVQEARSADVSVVRLLIEADEPDTANTVSLLDTVGNAIAYARAGGAQAPPSTEQTGATTGQAVTEIQVPGGLSAEGRQEAISLAREAAAAYDEVLAQAAGMPVRPAVSAVLAATAMEAASTLVSAGVTATADGLLQIDEARLEEALATPETAPATVSALSAFGFLLGAAAGALSEQPVSELLQPATLADLASEAGPLVPTARAPVTSLLRRYQPAQPVVDMLGLVGPLRGGLLVNLVV